MIVHSTYAKAFLLTCDKCGHNDSVATAKTKLQAKQVANSFFKWETDTTHGDLCPRCVKRWHNGFFDEDEANQ